MKWGGVAEAVVPCYGYSIFCGDWRYGYIIRLVVYNYIVVNRLPWLYTVYNYGGHYHGSTLYVITLSGIQYCSYKLYVVTLVGALITEATKTAVVASERIH